MKVNIFVRERQKKKKKSVSNSLRDMKSPPVSRVRRLSKKPPPKPIENEPDRRIPGSAIFLLFSYSEEAFAFSTHSIIFFPLYLILLVLR